MQSKFELSCTVCAIIKLVWKYELKTVNLKTYKCRKCCSSAPINHTCRQCNSDFLARKNEKRQFCSLTCAAVYTNKIKGPKLSKAWHFKSEDEKQKQLKGWKQHKDIRSSLNIPLGYKLSKITKNGEREFIPRKIHDKCKIEIKRCTGCDNLFVSAYAKNNHGRKTCSDLCKSKAVHCNRTYQNGSRKPVWYFNVHQNKNILLESSWEVKIATLLDQFKIVWIRPESIKWIDSDNKTRHYYPDFFIPKYNMFLDPKNPYCLVKDQHKLEVLRSMKIPLIVGRLSLIEWYVKSIK